MSWERHGLIELEREEDKKTDGSELQHIASQFTAPRQSEYHDEYPWIHNSQQYPNTVRQQACIEISTATTYQLIGDEATPFRNPTLFKIPLLIQKVKIAAQTSSLSLLRE